MKCFPFPSSLMPSQQSQLKDNFLGVLQPKITPGVQPVTQNENLGKRIDYSLFSLALDRIRPDADQVRRFNKSSDDASIQELAASIRADGILQPLDVRYLREENYYQIVAGERRYTAAKLAGLQEVPVKLLNATDSEMRRLQIVENIHREELSPLELGAALVALVEAGSTAEDLAKLLCKTTSYVTKALGIGRNLSPEGRQIVHENLNRFPSMAHLYDVSQLPAERQPEVLRRVLDEDLTREELQTITTGIKAKTRVEKASKGGRPAKPKHFSTVIPLEDATVTIRLRKATGTNEELAGILKEALATLH